jgi:chorismate synthase
MLSIPSTKGFEVGSGFSGTRMRGSQHNDKFVAAKGNLHNPTSAPEQKNTEEQSSNDASTKSSSSSSSSSTSSFPCPTNPASSTDGSATHLSRLETSSNRSGGIQGGISNGADIVFRVAFKPPATIGVAQETADFSGDVATLKAEGRHDPCVLPRAIPIVETMAALVLADQVLIQLSREQAALQYPIQGKVQPAAKPEGAKIGGWGQN